MSTQQPPAKVMEVPLSGTWKEFSCCPEETINSENRELCGRHQKVKRDLFDKLPPKILIGDFCGSERIKSREIQVKECRKLKTEATRQKRRWRNANYFNDVRINLIFQRNSLRNPHQSTTNDVLPVLVLLICCGHQLMMISDNFLLL